MLQNKASRKTAHISLLLYCYVSCQTVLGLGTKTSWSGLQKRPTSWQKWDANPDPSNQPGGTPTQTLLALSTTTLEGASRSDDEG